MALIKFDSKTDKNYTQINNLFIEKYMPIANHTYAIIYIYLYKSFSFSEEIKTEKIASLFNIMETDVFRAIDYWQEEGLLKVIEKDDFKMIEFLDFETEEENPKKEKISIKKQNEKVLQIAKYEEKIKEEKIIKETIIKETKEEEEEEEEEEKIEESIIKPFMIETKPVYSDREIQAYREVDNEIKELFDYAQKALGKLLSHNDLSTIFSFHDWLRMPIDLIQKLLEYCASNNHLNLRYIEKVAITWTENSIKTLTDAEEYIKLYNGDYRDIMKAFGISQRNITEVEENFMFKWINEYKTPMDLILLACEKTILSLAKPSFAYANEIIKKWHKQNLKTVLEVEKVEEDFYKVNKAGEKKQNLSYINNKKTNKFANYEQRNWDFDELERLEREYLKNI